MKKGIEVTMDHDCTGKMFLRVTKEKGHLSIEEVTESAREYEQDIYGLIIRALDDTVSQYYYDAPGDCVELYPVGELFMK